MSTGLEIIGIKQPDDKWKKMKAVYDACKAADLEIPVEVSEYFNGEDPEEEGVAILLGRAHGIGETFVREHYRLQVDTDGWCFIHLDNLPEDVSMIKLRLY